MHLVCEQDRGSRLASPCETTKRQKYSKCHMQGHLRDSHEQSLTQRQEMGTSRSGTQAARPGCSADCLPDLQMLSFDTMEEVSQQAASGVHLMNNCIHSNLRHA